MKSTPTNRRARLARQEAKLKAMGVFPRRQTDATRASAVAARMARLGVDGTPVDQAVLEMLAALAVPAQRARRGGAQ
jgi:hypothetical protein